MTETSTHGILDTSTVMLLGRIRDPSVLPDESLISATTLAELSVGPHSASSDSERAARQAHLQQQSPISAAAIPRLRRTLVAPCTTTIRNLASEVVLDPASDPIPRRSAVNLHLVESVSVAMLVTRLGRLSDARMRAVCGALAVAVACGQ